MDHKHTQMVSPEIKSRDSKTRTGRKKKMTSTAIVTPAAAPLVVEPLTVLPLTSLPIRREQCETNTKSFWNCFYPSMSPDCNKTCQDEFVQWLAGTKGLLTDLEALLNDTLVIRPRDEEDYSPLLSGHMIGIVPNASIGIPMPNVYLQVQVPAFFLKSDLQNFEDRYNTHFIEMKRYGDAFRWHVHVLPFPVRPFVKPMAELIKTKVELAQYLSDIFSKNPATSLDVIFKIPYELVQRRWKTPEAIKHWWYIFRNMKVERNGLPWLPPNPFSKDETKQNNLFRDDFVYFQPLDEIPFRWKMKLSSRHLLLFWLLKSPGEHILTKPETNSISTYGYPMEVSQFIRDWRRVTERA